MKTTIEQIANSKIGIQLSRNEAWPSLKELADEVISNAKEHGVALAKNLSLTREQFKELVNLAGKTAEHRFGTGSAELLDLNADPNPEKYVTGRVALPLHNDGAFVGTHPSYIILYCVEFNQSNGYGETEICDQKLAFESMPEHLKAIFEKDWEYKIHDASHFPSIAHKWISVPPLIKKDDGTTSFNLALPFDTTEKAPAWSVRLADHDEQNSRDLLVELDQFLKNCDAFYSHRWNVGDLLIINNSKVVHGRSTITENGTRHLFRGQLQ